MKILVHSNPFTLDLRSRAAPARNDATDRSREMSPQEKNLRALSDGLKSLRTQASPKKQAATRVAWLKQRLEIMKASLQFATPTQAKYLARELKNIAKELASIAHSMNSGGGESAGWEPVAFDVNVDGADSGDSAEAPADAAQAAEQAEAADAEAAQREAAAAGASASETQAADESGELDERDERDERNGNDLSGKGRATLNASGAADSDKSLRAALTETARLLKEVLSLLKIKLAELKDRESKEDIAAAEKYLTKLNEELSQSAGFYGPQGAVSVEMPSAVNVNVSA